MHSKRKLFWLPGLFMLIVLSFVTPSSLANAQERPVPHINGDWTSPTCETRPAGNGKQLYLKRNFREGTAFASGTLLFYS